MIRGYDQWATANPPEWDRELKCPICGAQVKEVECKACQGTGMLDPDEGGTGNCRECDGEGYTYVCLNEPHTPEFMAKHRAEIASTNATAAETYRQVYEALDAPGRI